MESPCALKPVLAAITMDPCQQTVFAIAAVFLLETPRFMRDQVAEFQGVPAV